MPCKEETKNRSKKLWETARETTESSKVHKTKHWYIVEAHESTRKRLESPQPRVHEDHTSETGLLKAAVDKEWEKLEKLPAWQLNKVKSKKKGSFRKH